MSNLSARQTNPISMLMKTLLIKIAQRCNHVEILTSNMTCKKTTTTMTKKKKNSHKAFV